MVRLSLQAFFLLLFEKGFNLHGSESLKITAPVISNKINPSQLTHQASYGLHAVVNLHILRRIFELPRDNPGAPPPHSFLLGQVSL